jgi:hypothetical protein
MVLNVAPIILREFPGSELLGSYILIPFVAYKKGKTEKIMRRYVSISNAQEWYEEHGMESLLNRLKTTK